MGVEGHDWKLNSRIVIFDAHEGGFKLHNTPLFQQGLPLDVSSTFKLADQRLYRVSISTSSKEVGGFEDGIPGRGTAVCFP